MTLSEDILTRVFIFILGVCGFLVARHIYQHKKSNAKPLVCPMRFDCSAVVHSGYSKFFGIPLEIFGMIYYTLLSLGYLFLIFTPKAMPENLMNFLIIISFLAFLFSIYLVLVQIFILKKGCSWCSISALICLLIFLLTISTYDFGSVIQIFIK